MALKACCDSYVHNSQPIKPQNKDFFVENHVCPKCKQKLEIKFQRIETIEGDVYFAPVSAEYK